MPDPKRIRSEFGVHAVLGDIVFCANCTLRRRYASSLCPRCGSREWTHYLPMPSEIAKRCEEIKQRNLKHWGATLDGTA